MFPLPVSGFGAIPTQSVPGPWPMLFVGLILLGVLLAVVASLLGLRSQGATGGPGRGPGSKAPDVRRPSFKPLPGGPGHPRAA